MKVSKGVTHLEVNNIGLIGNGWSKMVYGTSISVFILIIPQTKACFGECEVIKLTQVILHRNVSFQNELSMIVPLPVQGEIISVCV